MGLVLNSEGFPIKSDFFNGNASEPGTLEVMIDCLSGSDGICKPIIVLDAGISSNDNLHWLIDNGFDYIVVSRKRNKLMPEGVDTKWVKKKEGNRVEVAMIETEEINYQLDKSFFEALKKEKSGKILVDELKRLESRCFKTESDFLKTVKGVIGKEKTEKNRNLLLELAEKTLTEKELYCRSESKCKKEESMKSKFQQRFETDLTKTKEGLSKKGTVKKYEKIIEKIGRLREKYKRVSSYYDINITKEKNGKNAISISWKLKEKKLDDRYSGIYCLRTCLKHMDQHALWGIYVMLTEVEDAFRCMKSELGLRPVYHQIEKRVDGHLFITLLAYHIVHCIRFRLKESRVRFSWKTIRDRMSKQVRIASTIKSKDNKVIHVRKSSETESFHQKIYNALGLPHQVGETEIIIH